ncbi:hypothetical protein ACTA71_002632 [Dictyostelium dimigraforme]
MKKNGENFNEVNTFGHNDLNSSFLKNWFKNELQLLLNSSTTRSNKYTPAEIVFGRLPVDDLATWYIIPMWIPSFQPVDQLKNLPNQIFCDTLQKWKIMETIDSQFSGWRYYHR